jgi:ferrochelatase
VNEIYAPYDGVLLLSFGGPERAEEVMPFLENVARGRAIPAERLESVAEHYYARGGRSPINDANRALVEALRTELARRGWDLPVYWGNRNWRPFLADTLGEAHQAGSRHLVTVVTSAYSSYSGCRQYREDLDAALAGLAAQSRSMRLDTVRPYFNHPGFIAPTVEVVTDGLSALSGVSDVAADAPRIVFVTHSVPVSMDAASGPRGYAYTRQHLSVAEAVADAVSARLGRRLGWDLVYCSRSGSPRQPWLEPDIGDYLVEQARAGVTGVVVVPIGFISDHMEVVYDLDTEAAGLADRLGLAFVRAATVGTHPMFVAGLADLIDERAAQARGEQVVPAVVGSLGAAASVCPPGCCASGSGR